MRRTTEAILHWLEAFGGFGNTLLLMGLAVWLRVLLFVIDCAATDG